MRMQNCRTDDRSASTLLLLGKAMHMYMLMHGGCRRGRVNVVTALRRTTHDTSINRLAIACSIVHADVSPVQSLHLYRDASAR